MLLVRVLNSIKCLKMEANNIPKMLNYFPVKDELGTS
jgi:hypothetical protein